MSVRSNIPDINFIWEYYQKSLLSLNDREKQELANVDMADISRRLAIKQFFAQARNELDDLVKLDFLSAAEGYIREDFKKRVANHPTDPDNLQFTKLYENHENKFEKIPYASRTGDLCIIEI